MTSAFMEDFREKLIFCGIATSQTLEGCSKQEIEEIKSSQGVNFLPEIYSDFLHLAGRKAGRLNASEDFSYRYLLHLKEEAQGNLEWRNLSFRVPSDGFVFLMDQAATIYYFLTQDRNDD